MKFFSAGLTTQRIVHVTGLFTHKVNHFQLFFTLGHSIRSQKGQTTATLRKRVSPKLLKIEAS